MEAARILSESEVEPLPSPNLAPDTETWERVCSDAGTKYRGYIRERIVDGRRFPFTVLFNDRYGLVTGLPLESFNLRNLQAHLLKRGSATSRTNRRVSPEPRVRYVESTFDKLASMWAVNRAKGKRP